MKKFVWLRSYETGVPELDYQHNHLVSILNKASEINPEEENAEDHYYLALVKLMAALKSHLAFEEEWLRKNGGGTLGDLMNEHNLLYLTLKDGMTMLLAKEISVVALHRHLVATFENHLQAEGKLVRGAL